MEEFHISVIKIAFSLIVLEPMFVKHGEAEMDMYVRVHNKIKIYSTYTMTNWSMC